MTITPKRDGNTSISTDYVGVYDQKRTQSY